MHPLLESLEDRTLTVTEYLDLLNELMSPLRVFVEGEITDLKILPQWTFFSLKDADTGALLRCGLHSGVFRRIGVSVEEGMMVKVEGYGKMSPKSGNFGFWVSQIEPVGEGALRRAYELLIQKLQQEGMFTRKRTLPSFISHIGVISSRNGVVIQDLRNNLDKLGIRIDFVHSGVEGADSAGEILRAIEYFSRTPDQPEVLILIRGGGSLESLQGFNNEAVCRALYAAPMPVVVGIGHDVDAPIATYVADWSASTPTAVAHVINDSWSSITEKVPLLTHAILTRFRARMIELGGLVPRAVRTQHEQFVRRLHAVEHRAELTLRTMRHAIRALIAGFVRYEHVLAHAMRRLPVRLETAAQTGASVFGVLCQSMRARIASFERMVGERERLMQASDPARVLARGFAIVYDQQGTLVRTAAQLRKGDTLSTRVRDGTIESIVERVIQ